MADDDLPDPAVSGEEGPKRPATTHRPPSTFMVPEPDGSGLQRVQAKRNESERPEPDRGPPDPADVPSMDDYAERRRQDSSPRFAPLPRPMETAEPPRPEAVALIEERVTLWTEIEANWRSLLDDEFRHDIPERVEHALRAGHAAAADGLILALATRVCARTPSPENRQMLADISPRYPGSDQRIAGILELPANQLPATLIDHLDRYEEHATQQHKLRMEHAITPAFDRRHEHGRADDEATAPRTAPANDNGVAASPLAQVTPSGTEARAQEDTPALTGADGDNTPAPGAAAQFRTASRAGELDWRAMAMEAVVQLHREAAAETERGRTSAPTLTEHEQAESTREQSDTRRERQGHRLEQMAREVAREITRAPDRARDEDGGREL